MEETTKSIVGNPINNTKFENLPQHLIHHIMNFLYYEDATKFSVLSKTFYSLWLSFPVLDFDFQFFEEDEEPHHSFMSFILKTLHLRCPHHINKSLQRLRVSYHDMVTGYFPLDILFDALLTFAIENNCKEVIFFLTLDDDVMIDVRFGSLLRLFSSQFLTVLHLSAFRFPIADSIILCPKLKELEIHKCEGLQTVSVSSLSVEKVDIRFCSGLERVELNGNNLLYCSFFGVVNGIDELMQCDIACESIKNMYLYGVKLSKNLMELVTGSLFVTECDSPENLSVHNPRIKVLEMMDNYELENLFLSCPKLEFFRYESSKGQNCMVNIFECVALKVLILKRVTITDEWVRSTISEFGCLKELTIIYCDELGGIELKIDKLEMLSLKRCSNLKEVIVDAPNLLKFDYEGSMQVYPMQILSTKCITANVKLPKCDIDPLLWFGNLKQFLSCFDHIKDLTIICSQVKDLIFPRKFMKNTASPLRNLKHIKVQTKNILKDQTVRKLVESSLWLVHKPLELTLLISSTGRVRTLKFEYGKGVKRMKVKERCCLGIPTKCWRHYALKVDIQGFNESERSYLNKLFDPYVR